MRPGDLASLAPLAIVADVHGSAAALAKALERYLGQRHIVLVGDYVNRGPDSAQVMELLVELRGSLEITALMGNHDYALLEYLRSGGLPSFARMGGLATIRSYVGSNVDDPHHALTSTIPPSHVSLLESLELCFEREDLLISHCGISPRRQTSRLFADLVLGSHPDLFQSDSLDLQKVVVSGHYVQRDQTPYVSDQYICIDAGCGTIQGAPLTVLEWPERTFQTFEAR